MGVQRRLRRRRQRRRPAAALTDGARWLVAIAVLSALGAAAVGFLDFVTIPSRAPAHRVAVTHLLLNLAITVAFAGDFLWRRSETSPTEVGPLGLSVVSLTALGVSARRAASSPTATDSASPSRRLRRTDSAPPIPTTPAGRGGSFSREGE